MNNNPLNRFAFLDVAKGLGILAVVAGHIYPPGLLRSLIYLFHMPLFFFISGYLFKPKSGKELIAAKLQQLIVPYFSFLFIVYAWQNYDAFHSDAPSFFHALSLGGKALLGGRWLYGYTAAFWFVPVLFMVLAIANRLLKKTGKFTLLVALACLAAAYLNAYLLPAVKIPLNANVVLAALPLFLTGYYFKNRSPHYRPVICYVLAAAIVVATCFNRLPVMDLKMAVYGFPVLSFAAAIAIILLLLRLSKWIAEKHQGLSATLCALGKASLVIMFLHQPVQILLRQYLTESYFVRTVLAVAIPYLFYLLLKANTIGRAFFLGSKEDLTKLSVESQEFLGSVLLRAKLK